MRGYYVENFGCRATQADGAAIERGLAERGLAAVAAPQQAEVAILNTCTVTASADQDVRSAIRRIHRLNPGCRIVVTGCYAQRAPEELAAIAGVDWVVGNSHKHLVPQIAAGAAPGSPAAGDFADVRSFVDVRSLGVAGTQALVGDIFAHTQLTAAPVFGSQAADRTRPNLKVQDGCDNRCSFCIIPFVRGRSRSLPLESVLREVETLVEAGYREVVLSGINLGRWGRDFSPWDGGRHRFEHLLRAILERTAIEKVRISSVEPMDWSHELIALIAASPRVARHAHVPLQSGSDRVLRMMHRRYRPWHYREKIEKIRAAMPDAAIGADVMVGFPGETDELFEESRRFIEGLPFTYLHVFTYSSRPGTPSASMPEQVPPQVMRERNRVLREIAAERNRVFRESFVGRELQAITLTAYDAASDTTEALTDNYLKLRLRGRHAANQWLRVRVDAAREDFLLGTAERL